MRPPSFSLKQTRRLALQSQGLLRTDSFGKGRPGTLQAIRQLGYVQIDTISVVQRAHLHILRSRVSNFQQEMLDELLSVDRSIFEYWSHAAAYLPMEDYRFSLPRKQEMQAHASSWYQRDVKVMARVLDRIRAEGPLQSKDFAPPPGHKSGPWWDWKPAKKALEMLFHEGKLMIATRKGFQKVYDLPERVLPSHISTTAPDTAAFARHLCERVVQAHGFATAAEIAYLRKGMRKPVEEALQQLTEEKVLVPVTIENNPGEVYYAFPETVTQPTPRLGKRRVWLLSPFDNSVIQRKRLTQLYDFDFQIECYVPAPKRQYGYYSLPILFGDQFVGRLDPKADRKTGTLFIRKLWLEPTFRDLDALLEPLVAALQELALAYDSQRIEIEWIDGGSWGEEVCSRVSGA